MRIIAGAFRGRRLIAPAGDTTRPTSDRARQALFDMLRHAPWAGRGAVEGARVLDLFAGTGALGLEALSRGAAHATFVEHDRAALAALRANIDVCGARDQCQIHAADALAPPPGLPCSLVFLDPPYRLGLIERALMAARSAGLIAPGALVIAESARDGKMNAPVTTLAERPHGAAMLTIWREPDDAWRAQVVR